MKHSTPVILTKKDDDTQLETTQPKKAPVLLEGNSEGGTIFLTILIIIFGWLIFKGLINYFVYKVPFHLRADAFGQNFWNLMPFVWGKNNLYKELDEELFQGIATLKGGSSPSIIDEEVSSILTGLSQL